MGPSQPKAGKRVRCSCWRGDFVQRQVYSPRAFLAWVRLLSCEFPVSRIERNFLGAGSISDGREETFRVRERADLKNVDSRWPSRGIRSEGGIAWVRSMARWSWLHLWTGRIRLLTYSLRDHSEMLMDVFQTDEVGPSNHCV